MPDIINVSDLILRLARKTRAFSDSPISISDTVAQTSVREVIKTLSDSLTISEGLAIRRTKQRPVTQTLNISDELITVTVHATRARSLSEDVNISDAVTKSTVRDVIKTLTETLLTTEAIAKQPIKQRIISETATNITETLQAYKNDELLIPPLPPIAPQVPNLIGTRERAVRAVRRAPRPIVIDEIKNLAIAPLKLLAFSDSNNKAIARIGIKPRPTPNVALSRIILARSMSLTQCSIKTSLQPNLVKASLGLPLSSLNLTTAKLKLRPQQQSIHALKAVNFEKMHKLTRIMKIAMLAENV